MVWLKHQQLGMNVELYNVKYYSLSVCASIATVIHFSPVTWETGLVQELQNVCKKHLKLQ